MQQAQGLAPSDPFHTLQLLPSAPRELITRACALLVARADRAGNALRETSIMMAYDGAMAAARAHSPHADEANHYRVLSVIEDADAEIIALAYGVAIAAADDDAREAIEEARATLTNTYRRARYDAELHAAPAVAPVPIAPRPPSATIVMHDRSNAADAAAAVPAAHTRAPGPEAGDPHGSGDQLPLAFDPPAVVAARRGVLRRRVRNHPKKLSAPVVLWPHVAPVLPRPTDEGELVAELRFIDGPLAGATVPVADGKLTLGARHDDDVRLAGAAASLRIWRLDGRYLLRCIEGAVRIDNVPLTLPVAALEAGMILETGPHRAVFAFRRVPQALLPMLSAAGRADDRVAR